MRESTCLPPVYAWWWEAENTCTRETLFALTARCSHFLPRFFFPFADQCVGYIGRKMWVRIFKPIRVLLFVPLVLGSRANRLQSERPWSSIIPGPTKLTDGLQAERGTSVPAGLISSHAVQTGLDCFWCQVYLLCVSLSSTIDAILTKICAKSLATENQWLAFV